MNNKLIGEIHHPDLNLLKRTTYTHQFTLNVLARLKAIIIDNSFSKHKLNKSKSFSIALHYRDDIGINEVVLKKFISSSCTDNIFIREKTTININGRISELKLVSRNAPTWLTLKLMESHIRPTDKSKYKKQLNKP